MKDQQTFNYLKQFLTDERLAKIEHFAPESSDFVLPVMEDIFQFRNAAAIVRSVEACGFHKIVAMESENEFNPNLRVTKGAETWVEVEKLPHNLNSLKEINFFRWKFQHEKSCCEKNTTSNCCHVKQRIVKKLIHYIFCSFTYFAKICGPLAIEFTAHLTFIFQSFSSDNL